MTTDETEEQRIIRIARAMCRSARIDPDSTIDERRLLSIMREQPGSSRPQPAWTAFRAHAAAFAAQHPPEMVAAL
ncbi:hypothetical protein [Bosea sp. (in: a-proteobacteria)]|uniref:hypothetical protein n=1 Tax=Bosea sp. (in: a-proteobacteria) TaxID=1871050 RepID=UPI002FC7D877